MNKTQPLLILDLSKAWSPEARAAAAEARRHMTSSTAESAVAGLSNRGWKAGPVTKKGGVNTVDFYTPEYGKVNLKTWTVRDRDIGRSYPMVVLSGKGPKGSSIDGTGSSVEEAMIGFRQSWTLFRDYKPGMSGKEAAVWEAGKPARHKEYEKIEKERSHLGTKGS